MNVSRLETPEQPKRAVKPLGSPPRLPEHIPECSEERSIHSGRLANKQANSLSQFGEMGEERLVLNAVMSIQKENNEDSSPEASAASTLLVSTPIITPIHSGPLRRYSLEEIHLQANQGVIQKVLTPGARNTLERVQMTRSEDSAP